MKKLGFTLIELLISISILGIVTTIGVSSFLTAQKQARDSRRERTMLEIQSSFEQYYGEFGVYPTSAGGTIDSSFEDGTRPKDPKNSGLYVITWDYTEVDSYCVCSLLETKVGNADSASSTACTWNTTTGGSFCVQNKQ